MEVIEQELPVSSARSEGRLWSSHEDPRPERVVGRLGSSEDGPTLICLGSVHGNEPAGFLGLQKVVESLHRNATPVAGEFLALVGNRSALAARVRFVDEDLNRSWSSDRLDGLRSGRPPTSVEESELTELAAEIEGAIARARHGVLLLDLHTTSGHGPPFGVLDDTLPNRDFAKLFDVPHVVGLEEELDGTVLSHYVARGVRTFGLESGQHAQVDAIDGAEAAVWVALAGLGLVDRRDVPDLELAEARLRAGTENLPSVFEVRYRHAIGPADGFTMNPGFLNFQPIEAGEILARDAHGPVAAPEGGRVLLPLYQQLGEDGFFVVRRVSGFWMWLSAVMRRIGAERFVHWLPGVRRAPVGRDSFIVNRRVARWFALELLHLLGFRRHGRSGQYLVVSRRPDASRPPSGGPASR